MVIAIVEAERSKTTDRDSSAEEIALTAARRRGRAMNSHKAENKMRGMAATKTGIVLSVGQDIDLRDEATGEVIAAKRALFEHGDEIRIGDRYTYETIHGMKRANRVRREVL